MRKRFAVVLSLGALLTGGLGVLTACGHTHTFADTYSYDGEYHWYAATCEHKDEVKDKAKHTMSGDACTICSYTKSAAADALYEDTTKSVTTLVCGEIRVQLLSDSLVRIESKGAQGFEDRESYIVYNRDDWGEKVAYTQSTTDDAVKISTESYIVVLPKSGGAGEAYITDKSGETLYSYRGLTNTNVALPSPSDELASWYFTDSPRVIPSDYGYSPSDNGAPLQGWDFGNNATDIFAFLPNGDYKTFMHDFVSLTGQSEMVDLKTFGQWDSRYYAYTHETALKQIKDYQSHGFAIDVLVVDTDWRKKTGGQGIGYDINTELFPDMEQFLRDAHALGANICFNDHPEPVSGTDNLLDKSEVAYRNEKLTMLLALGVDYWWYDRNWSVALNQIDGEHSRYATGMYAYQWISEKYYESLVEEGKVEEYARRAIIMSNVDGCNNGSYTYASDLSAHRYSIQWTGDIGAKGNWLRQEIEGAVYAGAELGIPYVSADVGGHNVDPSNEEYIRWYQFGALSPILRVHCWNETTKGGRMPWNYGATAEEVAHAYQDMRYRLLPLYYALAHENHETGLPLIRRLDIGYPQYAEAGSNDEYLLGDHILVAPISEWTGNDTRDVFLPDGAWIDVWTGNRYAGPVTVEVNHKIKTSPIFVREGALIALAQNMKNVDEKDWSELSLEVYPSANFTAKTTLYEDDTRTVAYKDGKYRTTDIAMSCTGNVLKIEIGAAQGSFTGDRAFAERTWNVRLHKNPEWGAVKSVKVNGEAVTVQTIIKLTYENGGRPFAFKGGALDGEIDTFTIGTEASKKYTVEIEYESVKQSASNADYDATTIGFTVSASACEETSVDLTKLGTTDWVSYGYNSGTSVDYKKGGPRLFSAPSDKRCMLDAPTLQYKGMQITTGLQKTYSDGNRKTSNTVKGGTKNAIGYDFTVKTTGKKETVVLYLGGGNTLAKLTVRDRAGNVKTLFLGGREQSDFTEKIVIEVEAGEASTLYLSYAPVVYKTNNQATSSYVVMYCGYLAGKD